MANEKTAAALGDDCRDPDCDVCHYERTAGVARNAAHCLSVQAPAHADTGDVVYVAMTKNDAMVVGQTLRSLARDRKTPLGVRESLSRVGTQMTSEAMLAMKGGRS